MDDIIYGLIPNVTMGNTRGNFYLFFSHSAIFVVEDRNVDAIMSESSVGMWPASGAVIDSIQPSASLRNFKDKHKNQKFSLINESILFSLSYVNILYSDLSSVVFKKFDSETMSLVFKSNQKITEFTTDYIDSSLFSEYKEMLTTIFKDKLVIVNSK